MIGTLGVWVPIAVIALLTLAAGVGGAVALVRYGFGQYWVFVGRRRCTVYNEGFGWCWLGPDDIGQMQYESRATATDAARRHTRRYLDQGVRPLDRVRLSGGLVYTSPSGEPEAGKAANWCCTECGHSLIEHLVTGGCRKSDAGLTNPRACSCAVDLDATPEAARPVPVVGSSSGAVR